MCQGSLKQTEYTREEVSQHKSEQDCWIVLGDIDNGESQVLHLKHLTFASYSRSHNGYRIKFSPNLSLSMIFCKNLEPLKLYDVTSFIDKHPGGPDILVEVGGKYAQEEFEDIGHSSEARDILQTLQIGVLKLSAEEMEEMKLQAEALKIQNRQRGGFNLVMILSVLIAIAAGIYRTQFA